jgi:GNAT superfamily N-acetyltransferase
VDCLTSAADEPIDSGQRGGLFLVINIAPARPGDGPALAGLLAEMGRFYGVASSEPVELRVRQIDDALFSSPAAASALLAWDGPEPAGVAAYSFLWPAAGLTRSLYLKELYVGASYRRHGVGELLMRAVFETAARHGCSRVEWTTDTGNAGARAFYRRLGLPEYPAKVFYRVQDTGAGFQAL